MSEVGFLVGRNVVAVQVNPDGSTRIVFDPGDKPEPALYADVGDSTYKTGSGTTQLLPDMIRSVVSGTSTEGGTLLLSFADGSVLRCEPDPHYEAWQVVGGNPQHLVVCTPGGELAVWDSSVPTETQAQEAVEVLKRMTGWDVHVREITETGEIIIDPPRRTSLEAEDS